MKISLIWKFEVGLPVLIDLDLSTHAGFIDRLLSNGVFDHRVDSLGDILGGCGAEIEVCLPQLPLGAAERVAAKWLEFLSIL